MSAQTIIVIAILVVGLIYGVINFIQLPAENRIEAVKEWLKWAVAEAEKDLGSGTGQLKLRYVYDLAVKQFPWIVKTVSFELFSQWVDEALEWMRGQLDNNEAVKHYVLG